MDSENSINSAQLFIAPGLTAGRPLGFHKSEKLRYRNLVEALFSQGKSVYAPPLRLVWRIISEDTLQNSFRRDIPEIGKVQFMITVPKKKHRKAVERVRIRRLIREAYRLNRDILAPAIIQHPQIRTLSLGFIFLDDSMPKYQEVEKCVKNVLSKVVKKINAAAAGVIVDNCSPE